MKITIDVIPSVYSSLLTLLVISAWQGWGLPSAPVWPGIACLIAAWACLHYVCRALEKES